MHHNHSRTLKISKAKLIEKITENKANHIKEFDEATKAYVEEAHKQLKLAKKDIDSGKLNIRLNLTVPINRVEEYDKVIEMFNWEIADEIELTQSEFNEYVHDDNDRARTAKFSNAFYATSKSL